MYLIGNTLHQNLNGFARKPFLNRSHEIEFALASRLGCFVYQVQRTRSLNQMEMVDRIRF